MVRRVVIAITSVAALVFTPSLPLRAQTGPAGPTDGPQIPPLYAALFEDGRSFTYDFRSAVQDYAPDAEQANEDGYVTSETNGTFSCTVRTRQLAEAIVGTLECGDEPEHVLGFHYAATPAGLFLIHDEPADDAALATLLPNGLHLFDAVPQEVTETESSEQGARERRVSRDSERGWCVAHWVAAGDETNTTRCVAEGLGFTWAAWSTAGGTSRSVEYTLQTSP